ncbi:hypothetical protein [Hoeflea sp.]|uniref:hypothetical protein n=1 Tax=Hoeflea sp. TaxID=1940281 RepID=UPI003BB0BE80
MEQRYSIQQIKFELLSYLKEFGTNGADWTIQLTTGTEDKAVSSLRDAKAPAIIWICKPTLSERAASLIKEHMVSRFGMQSPDFEEDASASRAERNWVLMYREGADHAAA